MPSVDSVGVVVTVGAVWGSLYSLQRSVTKPDCENEGDGEESGAGDS